MNLGENIYHHRTRKKLSQEALAEALEVSRQSVSKWENNSAVPELEKLIRMAQLFGVTLDELVGNAPLESIPETVSEHTSKSALGITTEDLISVLLLLFGILIPVVILATSKNHNSNFLMVLGLFVIPPAVTIGAAFCSPKNKLLFRVYVVYNIVFGLLAVVAGNVLAPLIAILYIFAIGFWNDRRA